MSSPMRRLSVSIHDYPEDLNPFKDEGESSHHDEIVLRKSNASVINSETRRENKDQNKNKFWTFGRSRKKRSNSFSIKSTWHGIFGKRKDTDSVEKKPNISTVSSTYNRASYNNVQAPSSRVSKDQQEFDEALGTLARRRKYTLDNSSKYSSSLTVNGDSARIYEGCPQATTASILGDLTPKPPVRRFGQVNSKPTDEIPPLNYSDKEFNCDEDTNIITPIPPKRGTMRSSQRLYPDDMNSSHNEVTMTDENENMPEDYVFKRFSQDAVRKSNLSINSCISTGSVYHSGRKKRRAPLPPTSGLTTKTLQSTEQNDVNSEIEQITAITRVVENIDDLTKIIEKNATLSLTNEENDKKPIISTELKCEISGENDNKNTEENLSIKEENLSYKNQNESHVDVELKREVSESVEIIQDIDEDNVTLRKKESSSSLSNSENFSVKEEIEKIERQIKLLETTELRRSSFSNREDLVETRLKREDSRRSLQENRRHFFRELTRPLEDQVKIEIKELPRKQNDIKIVRLVDPPSLVANDGPENPVKVIELHISEPIKRKPEFSIDIDINPIPKPRRNSPQQLENNNLTKESNEIDREEENTTNS